MAPNAFAAAAVLRTLGARETVVRFFRNISAPATHLAVYRADGVVVGAFAYNLSGGPNTGAILRTAGTFVAPCARREGVAEVLWKAVRNRVGRDVEWVAPTISRRGTAFVEHMRGLGFQVTEERKWPVRRGEAARYERRAFR